MKRKKCFQIIIKLFFLKNVHLKLLKLKESHVIQRPLTLACHKGLVSLLKMSRLQQYLSGGPMGTSFSTNQYIFVLRRNSISWRYNKMFLNNENFWLSFSFSSPEWYWCPESWTLCLTWVFVFAGIDYCPKNNQSILMINFVDYRTIILYYGGSRLWIKYNINIDFWLGTGI